MTNGLVELFGKEKKNKCIRVKSFLAKLTSGRRPFETYNHFAIKLERIRVVAAGPSTAKQAAGEEYGNGSLRNENCDGKTIRELVETVARLTPARYSVSGRLDRLKNRVNGAGRAHGS